MRDWYFILFSRFTVFAIVSRQKKYKVNTHNKLKYKYFDSTRIYPIIFMGLHETVLQHGYALMCSYLSYQRQEAF